MSIHAFIKVEIVVVVIMYLSREIVCNIAATSTLAVTASKTCYLPRKLFKLNNFLRILSNYFLPSSFPFH